jgi:tetratricopeptide (TPR) repeat protein
VSQANARTRSDTLGLALLTLAIVGPVFHWIGVLTRGASFFYVDFTKLLLVYLFLAASAGAAAWLIMRPVSHLLRILAISGLLLNLASIAYAGRLWRSDAQQLVGDTTLVPIALDKIGIIIAPVSDTAQALAEAHALEAALNNLVKQTSLDSRIEIRQVHELTSRDQAQQMGSRLRANVVIWGTETGSELLQVEHNITSLGAGNAEISLDSKRLLLLLATIDTIYIPENRLASENQISTVVDELLAPTVLGFSALAASEPVLATGYFQTALEAHHLTTETMQSLAGYMSLAFMFADRLDLAQTTLGKARENEPDASTWLLSGYLALYQNDQSAAMDYFMQARALAPRSVQAYCALGVVSSQQHNITRALSLFSQAITLQPAWGIPYVLLAQANELAGNMNAALAAYDQARLYSSPFSKLPDLVSQRNLQLAQKPPTPVPTATILPTPSPMPIPGLRYHTVAKGETLQKIAAQYNVSEDNLAKVNKLKNQNVLYVGQVLIIPDE